ncbi:unannotated protein [freshwater metagenome]|uniref:Unannotated protein n=1 Tax=freshwater metagenome TaxID=449393 RepID=A0A6J7FP99_9ZZZZ
MREQLVFWHKNSIREAQQVGRLVGHHAVRPLPKVHTIARPRAHIMQERETEQVDDAAVHFSGQTLNHLGHARRSPASRGKSPHVHGVDAVGNQHSGATVAQARESIAIHPAQIVPVNVFAPQVVSARHDGHQIGSEGKRVVELRRHDLLEFS